jgi:acetoin utilization protein AcuA
MSANPGKEIEYKTSNGLIYINIKSDWEFIQTLEFDEGIGVFPHYRSMLRDKKYIHRLLNQYKGRMVISSTQNRKIVGYIAFSHPVPAEGWPEDLVPVLYELGSIEVSRNWRKVGLAKRMLQAVMDDDEMNDYIVVLSGYSWHWDLEGTGLTKISYRKMLMKLFGSIGFRHYYTNEPNVLMDAANMLMAKVGSRVSKGDHDRFIEALFSFKNDSLM